MSVASFNTLPMPSELVLGRARSSQGRVTAQGGVATTSSGGDTFELSPDALMLQRMDHMRLNAQDDFKQLMGDLATKLHNNAAANGQQNDPRMQSLIASLSRAGDTGELPELAPAPSRPSGRQHTGVRSYSLSAPATGLVEDDPVMQLFALFDEHNGRELESMMPSPLPFGA